MITMIKYLKTQICKNILFQTNKSISYFLDKLGSTNVVLFFFIKKI